MHIWAKQFGEIEDKIDDFENVKDFSETLSFVVKPTLNIWTNLE